MRSSGRFDGKLAAAAFSSTGVGVEHDCPLRTQKLLLPFAYQGTSGAGKTTLLDG